MIRVCGNREDAELKERKSLLPLLQLSALEYEARELAASELLRICNWRNSR
jgi:hypothetical protein